MNQFSHKKNNGIIFLNLDSRFIAVVVPCGTELKFNGIEFTFIYVSFKTKKETLNLFVRFG